MQTNRALGLAIFSFFELNFTVFCFDIDLSVVRIVTVFFQQETWVLQNDVESERNRSKRSIDVTLT